MHREYEKDCNLCNHGHWEYYYIVPENMDNLDKQKNEI